jgi:hypothetical protein
VLGFFDIWGSSLTTDYTDVVARFSDKLAAETLAKFISEAGFPCDVETSDSVGLAGYRIRMLRTLIPDMLRDLNLTVVAKFEDPLSAEVVAGRLVRENIPCYLGGGGRDLRNRLGFVGIPWNYTGELGLFTVAVPASLSDVAQGILKEPPLTEAELTKLALRTGPDPDNSI